MDPALDFTGRIRQDPAGFLPYLPWLDRTCFHIDTGEVLDLSSDTSIAFYVSLRFDTTGCTQPDLRTGCRHIRTAN